MSGSFTFNGTSSAELGLLVSNVSNFGAPSRVVEKIQVPYRNGDLLIDTGTYTNYTVTYTVSLIHNAVATTRDIAEWLLAPQGYCELTDSYNTGETRYAAYYGDINYTMEHLNRYGRATISFDCKPQRYLDSGQSSTTISGSDSITNPTAFAARPFIETDGWGTFYIGDYEITVTNPGIVGVSEMYIDCESMQCYFKVSTPPDILKVNGSPYVTMPQGFPVLKEGANAIDATLMSGGTVTITPRWWKL